MERPLGTPMEIYSLHSVFRISKRSKISEALYFLSLKTTNKNNKSINKEVHTVATPAPIPPKRGTPHLPKISK